MVESFIDYTTRIEKVVTDDIPKLIQNVEQILLRMDEIKERAQSNFENLDTFGKVKATKSLASNVATATKVPSMLKKAGADLAEELKDLKDAIEKIQKNVPKLEMDGKKCFEQKA